MSIISNEAAGRREAARQGSGQFGHQLHSESGITLGAAPETDSRIEQALDTALERIGVDRSEVDGWLTESFHQRYATLSEPRPRSVRDVAAKLGITAVADDLRERGDGLYLSIVDRHESPFNLYTEDFQELNRPDEYDPEDDRLLLTMFTRNGGGNRECWDQDEDGRDCGDCTGCSSNRAAAHPLIFSVVDDDGDRTYATYAWSVPEDRVSDALEGLSNRDQVHARQRLEEEFSRVESGQIPPWSHLATEEQKSQFRSVSPEGIEAAEKAADEFGSKAAAVEQALEVLHGRSGAEFNIPALKWNLHYADAPAKGDVAPMSFLRKERNRHDDEQALQELPQRARALSAKAPAKAQAEQMLAQAEALPAGPLRSWLLDERPERSYQTTEGTGRKKKTVTKTYRPKPELVKTVDEAREGYERAAKEALESEQVLRRLASGLRRNEQDKRKNAAEIRVGSKLAWTAGWQGRSDCPPRPAAHEQA